MALLSVISVTYSQPWSKNIKWKIPEIIHSCFNVRGCFLATQVRMEMWKQ
jgi:hypothetical protein